MLSVSYYQIDMRNGTPRRGLVSKPTHASGRRQTHEFAIEEIGLFESLKAAADVFVSLECNGLRLQVIHLADIARQLIESGLAHGWSWDEWEFREILENTRRTHGLASLRDGQR